MRLIYLTGSEQEYHGLNLNEIQDWSVFAGAMERAGGMKNFIETPEERELLNGPSMKHNTFL